RTRQGQHVRGARLDRAESWRWVLRTRTAARRRAPRAWAIAPTVVFLGLTSFFTDISTEMVNAVLPIYLVVSLGLSPLTFGAVDAVYQGSSVLFRLLAGVVADRWQRHRDVAAFGYALSTLSRLGLLIAGAAWAPIATVIAVD